MTSTNFNMSFDPIVKAQFAEVLADYGLTVPQAFKLFANQVIKTQSIPLSFDWRANQVDTPAELRLGKRTVQSLEEGSADYLAGKLERLSPDTALTTIQALAHG